ncbi:MAG: TetR/AcrR family transcriptional regulator [Xanthobacteraceae bacterium]
MPVAATSKIKKPAVPKAKADLEPIRDAERTRRAILDAAEIEFADKGLAGARVDVIAEESCANKRMLYYYFGSKEDLYMAVLERAYGAMRERERELNFTDLEPLDAIKTLVEFKFDYYVANPRIIPLLAAENMNGGKYLKRSRRLRDMHLSLIDMIRKVLAAGERQGVIRPGIDPFQLYVSFSALSYFYFSNAATLSTAFGRDLMSAAERKARRTHAVGVITSYVKA